MNLDRPMRNAGQSLADTTTGCSTRGGDNRLSINRRVTMATQTVSEGRSAVRTRSMATKDNAYMEQFCMSREEQATEEATGTPHPKDASGGLSEDISVLKL